MSAGGWVMALVVLATVLVLVYLALAVVRSVQRERTPGVPLGREFSLGLILMGLFFFTWALHAVTQWQQFTDEQLSHGQHPAIGDFVADFLASTLQNWQSEFLQLFSFVVLAALYIHKGSAESRDSDDRIEAALERIEKRLEEVETSRG